MVNVQAESGNRGRSGIGGAVQLCGFFLKERVKPGDIVLDATCGNGQDTLLLAELVGEKGRVFAFDLQETAIQRTRERLAAAGLLERVCLVHAGHERMAEFAGEGLKAVVFNLGYLPAGDREVTTMAGTTLVALAAGARLLLPGGILLIAVYTGHDNGEEWAGVREWCSALDPKVFNAWHSRQLNRSEAAPFLVLVEKVAS